MKQLWTMGIRDTKLLQIIKQILKAPIVLPNGEIEYPTKGTPQGGVLSPLLANIVLNELDWWLDSQWEGYATSQMHINPLKPQVKPNGGRTLSNEYKKLRETNLKEFYFVRYADDFKIMCKDYQTARKVMIATTKWLDKRLHLEVSPEKTGIANLKKQSCEFIGFKFKLKKSTSKDYKGKKNDYSIQMHIAPKNLTKIQEKLTSQVKRIQRPKSALDKWVQVNKYNVIVRGLHNYYSMATLCSIDLHQIGHKIDKAMHNRLDISNRDKVTKKNWGNKDSKLKEKYGKSEQVKWIKIGDSGNYYPLIPVSFIQHENPLCHKKGLTPYTPEGREAIYKRSWNVNYNILSYMANHPIENKSIEYNDNRQSKYCQQKGKCSISGELLTTGNIHCHHKVPVSLGGTDEYKNLTLVTTDVHRLIHATNPATIQDYLNRLNLDKEALKKLNAYRKSAKLKPIPTANNEL